MKIKWNTDSVYTMALWSGKRLKTNLQPRVCLFLIFTITAYADWREWQVLNFPGIRPFSITSLVGVQPVKLTLYTQHNIELPSHTTTAIPLPPRDIIFTIEVSHSALTTLGCEAQKWIAENAERTAKVNETVVSSEIDSFNRNDCFGEDDELDEQFYDNEKYEEDLVDADELVDTETSCYLLSGTTVSLREGNGHYVSIGGGYAILQSSRATIVLEKVQPKSKKIAACSSAAIVRSGDVVRVQLVDVATKAVKFLAIHRGWWLRWSSVRPKRNGLFCIHTAELIGSPVLIGLPFSLHSLRWPHYSVGACIDSSVKYGGRILGIYKTGRVVTNDDIGGVEDDDSDIRETEIDFPDRRMMSLLLRAESWACLSPQSPLKVLVQDSHHRNDEIVLSAPILEDPHYDVDILVWLEIINRTKRTKQLVYGIRLKEAHSRTGTNSSGENRSHPPPCRMTLKLLTGRALAPVLQLVEQTSDFFPSPDKGQKRYVVFVLSNGAFF